MKQYEQPKLFTEQFRNAYPIALLLEKSTTEDTVDNQFDAVIPQGDLSANV